MKPMTRPLEGWKEIERFTSKSRWTLKRHRDRYGLPVLTQPNGRPLLWPDAYRKYTEERCAEKK